MYSKEDKAVAAPPAAAGGVKGGAQNDWLREKEARAEKTDDDASAVQPGPKVPVGSGQPLQTGATRRRTLTTLLFRPMRLMLDARLG
ncbi:hypothetical protein DIPPA_20637 [Diplonema papillatum]|nr:hypothetical protein DIPPA_20637 [Diplonema papillatum]